eukprot:XP_001701339.1 predicted protein [Chlamydomonas reinhardtii]
MSVQELLRQAAEEVAELAREGLKNVHVLDFHPALWITPVSLPTGGLDVVTCQDLLYSLRSLEEQAASPHGRETPVADAWLRAVQCAQLAQDRLLADLHAVERHLAFWQQQVAAGGGWSHAAFLLLARGPASFAADSRLARAVARVSEAAGPLVQHVKVDGEAAMLRLDQVYLALTALFAAADRTSRYSEWRLLQADLLRLAAPGSGPRERLATHGRMMRTYSSEREAPPPLLGQACRKAWSLPALMPLPSLLGMVTANPSMGSGRLQLQP